MTRSLLRPAQSQLLHIIEDLAFGRIEELSIRNGEPCYEHAPRIVQEIKLGSETERRPDQSKLDLTLKKEFVELFSALTRLRDGVVAIEVRHRAPFRLVLERYYKEFLP
jgi:hypothetical protein